MCALYAYIHILVHICVYALLSCKCLLSFFLSFNRCPYKFFFLRFFLALPPSPYVLTRAIAGATSKRLDC